jgi:DNA sulfur modification protein DndB
MADAADPVARVIREILARVTQFSGLVEMNKATLAPRSGALFTVSALFQATRVLLQPLKTETDRDRLTAAQAFWRKLFEVFEDWNHVRSRDISSGEIRQNFIHAHGVVLDALAQVAAQIVRPGSTEWAEKLDALRSIDWSRGNPVWEGRALLGGKVSKARQNVVLTATAIKTALGLPLTEAEQESESALQRSKHDQGNELAGQTEENAD